MSRNRGRRNRRIKRKRRKGWIWIVFILVAMLLAAGFWMLGQNYEGTGKDEYKSKPTAAWKETAETDRQSKSQDESTSDFYFRQLSEEEQHIYTSLLKGVSSHRESVEILGADTEKIGKVYQFLLNDHPELFWCSGTLQMTHYPMAEKIELFPEYLYDNEESMRRQKEIESAAQEWLADIPENVSEYEKIKYLYEQIVWRTEYQEGGADDQNIYSVLQNGESVCAGYAKTMQYLAGKAGIFVTYVTGTATDPDTGETQDHAWNLVKCDGKYSYVDTTWADPVWTEEGTQKETIVYDYLCCPQEQLFLTHIPEESVVLPVCDAYEQEYYRKNNRFYENYEKQQICQALREDVEGQKSESALKFGSADAFGQAEVEIREEILPEMVQYLGELYGLSTVEYFYREESAFQKITIYWKYE